MALVLGSGAMVGGQLLFALAPPTKWDALVYHLELPRRYLSAGRFTFVSENPFWGHPQVAEMLFTWAAALRGWETAAVFGWAFGLCVVIGVLGLTARWSNPRGGWIAVTALLAGSTFRWMFGWSYQDSLVTLYGLATLIAMLAGVTTSQRRWILWAGCFAGLSVSTKLTSALVIPALVLLPLLDRQSRNSSWRLGGLAAALIAIAVFCPWLLKNLMATGNPLYPHGWETAWTPGQRLAYYRGTGLAVALQHLWLPLAVTWNGLEGGPGFAADIGPLLAILAVPGLASRWRDRAGRTVALWLGLGWVAIVVGGLYSAYLAQTRLYFALLPAAALGAAWGWQRLETVAVAGVRLWWVTAVVVLTVLGLALWQDAVWQTRLNPAGVLTGTQSDEQYLDQSLGWYRPAMRALGDLPSSSRILMLWEPRNLYAPFNTQADVWLDRWYIERRTIGDWQAILESWREAGFTHLLIYRFGADFERTQRTDIPSADWEALDMLLSALGEPAGFGGVYMLYDLTE